MRFHATLLGALAALPHVLAYWPMVYGDTMKTYRNIEPKVKVETLHQFDTNGTWIDNLALRSDGSVLLTRLDTPEVWAVNTTSGDAKLAYHFPNATSCFGISEIDDDVFAVVVGNFSTVTYQPVAGSFSVQKLDFKSQAEASVIAALPDAQALNGMATFTKESQLVLIADSPKGTVWKVNIETGDYDVALNHTTMLPSEDGALPLGINGVRVVGEYVYYSSTTRMEFCRVKVDKHASAIGDYEVIASGFLPDNFDVTSDGTAYVATDPQNSVVRITDSGQISLVAGGQLSTLMPGPTSGQLSEDGKTLYVGTSGGQIAPVLGTFKEPAKVVKISFQ